MFQTPKTRRREQGERKDIFILRSTDDYCLLVIKRLYPKQLTLNFDRLMQLNSRRVSGRYDDCRHWGFEPRTLSQGSNIQTTRVGLPVYHSRLPLWLSSHVCVCVCMCMCMCMCVYVSMCAYVYVYVSVRVRVCVCECVVTWANKIY